MKLTEPFERALCSAVRLHREQFRKGGELPYVGHLLGVCSLALEHGADQDEAIAALLHDSIEDQAESFGGVDKLRTHLRTEFGDKVLAIVEGCTDAETVPKPPWRERKERYVAHLAGASSSVLLVSACDKLHNARAILQDYREVGEALWARFSKTDNALFSPVTRPALWMPTDSSSEPCGHRSHGFHLRVDACPPIGWTWSTGRLDPQHRHTALALVRRAGGPAATGKSLRPAPL